MKYSIIILNALILASTTALSHQTNTILFNKKTHIKGIVVSLPKKNHTRTQFLLNTNLGKFQLSWYNSRTTIRPGQTWQLTVKLKPAQGLANFGGPNFDQWFHAQGIVATGYVIHSHNNRVLKQETHAKAIDQFRYDIQQGIKSAIPNALYLGIIEALTIGEKSDIPSTQKLIFQKTGTSHLIAISGLHIGLVAGLMYLLFRIFWAMSTFLTLRFTAPKAAVIASIIAALIYCALAGFSIPTQRALIMLCIIGYAHLTQQYIKPLNVLMLTAAMVLCLDPLSTVSPGFWLSFGVVFFFIYALSGRVGPQHKLTKWLYPQWVAGICMIPLTLYWFNGFSLSSFIANIIAIPVMSFIVVPLSLLGTLCLLINQTIGTHLLELANWVLGVLWPVLQALANIPFLYVEVAKPSLLATFSALLGLLILLMPKGLPGRYLSIIFILPLFFSSNQKLPHGNVSLTVLDVGQGLATVIQTRNHTLVYDTGPSYASGFNSGSKIVAPYLTHLSTSIIDTLVVSHGDNDHAGGAAQLAALKSIKQIYTSNLKKLKPLNAILCQQGMHFIWDGVLFEFLSPAPHKRYSGNNASCVLKVTTGDQSILLPGDIEKATERKLVKTYGHELKSTLIVAPHHGSTTSSTLAFLNRIKPEYVIYSTGLQNRFGFPKKAVVNRYNRLGAEAFNTSVNGAVKFIFSPNSVDSIKCARRCDHSGHFDSALSKNH